MKLLVTGSDGQLGSDIIKSLKNRKIDVIAANKNKLDITDFSQVKSFIETTRPQGVIHCAAYTKVDLAEENRELCLMVNQNGTENIAKVCSQNGIKMLYLSTDYVFPGNGDSFYEIEDETGPVNVYGESKLLGEMAIKKWMKEYFIVRISWVFGEAGASNFVKTMIRLGKEKKEIKVVKDQIGSPTYTKDLSQLLCDMILTKRYGVYHATNEGVCSWAEFAREIMEIGGFETKIIGIESEAYPSKAKRPKNSRLSKDSLDKNGFSRLPDWKDALRRYLKEEMGIG